MNWLLRIAARDDYLAGLGATPDIIQFIMSQEDADYAQFLTNQFRMNPGITIEDLQSTQMPVKENPYSHLEEENAELLIQWWPNEKRYQCLPFRQWVLVELRKHRIPNKRYTYDVSNIPIFVNEDAMEGITTSSLGDVITYVLRPIKDWVIATEPEIASYSLESAIAATKEWEQATRGEGNGEVYDGQDNIEYQWSTGPYAGWTIQQIFTQNNAIVEGNEMSHCVGDCKYDDAYDIATSKKEGYERGGVFYDHYMGAHVTLFSLRDPKNQPHVTIELGAERYAQDESESIFQIYGPGNSEPKPEYKALIKQWLAARGNKMIWGDDPYFDLDVLKNYYPRDLDDEIQKLVYGGDDYGITTDIANINMEKLYDVCMEVLGENNRDYSSSSSSRAVARTLADIAWDIDKQWLKQNCGQLKEADFNKNSAVQVLQNQEEKNWDNFYMYWQPHEPMPDEDDFEDPKEFQEAYKNWGEDENQAQDWAMEENLSTDFTRTALNHIYGELAKKDPIEELKKKCLIPTPPDPKTVVDSTVAPDYTSV